jgi:zinc transport system ATP-binding protein
MPATPADTTLDVSRLTVSFGDTHVFTDLSFRIAKGSSLAVIGPNGAGKTVLFRALIGSLPSTGTVHWAAGARIGYVPQKLDIERDIPITGVDFLHARLSGQNLAKSISDLLELVGLPSQVAHRSIGAMSGGQFQRLLVAFALAGDPNVLLLDEPTSGVDEPGQERLNELLRRLQRTQSLTVLFISHELSVVYQYATEVLCLTGAKAWFGPPQTILTPDRLREVYGSEINYHFHEHSNE